MSFLHKSRIIGLTTLMAAVTLSSNLSAEILIKMPYARAVAPGQTVSAVFAELENTGDEDIRLIGGRSSMVKNVELHISSSNEQGVMKMRQIEAVDIPAKSSASLKPGAKHIMLLGLQQPLVAGGTIDIELLFSNGEKKSLDIPVKSIMAAMKH